MIDMSIVPLTPNPLPFTGFNGAGNHDRVFHPVDDFLVCGTNRRQDTSQLDLFASDEIVGREPGASSHA